MEEKHITIILGAGAMTDVTGITTNSLTELILDNVLIKNIASDLDVFFQQNYNNIIRKENVNFEDIMHALETLYNFKFCKPEFVKKFKPVYCMFGKLKDKYENITVQEIEKAQNEINEKIKNVIFSFEKKYMDDVNSWFVDFFKSLKKLNENDIYLDIFSLNYDNWLENILNIKNNGFENDNEFNLKKVFNISKQNTINHLHGHINLFPKVYARQSQTGEYIERDIIISGLNKLEKMISAPFSTYKALLQECLIKNSDLLIIGYGFNDLYINSMLRDFIKTHNKNKKVIFIGRKKCENNLWEFSSDMCGNDTNSEEINLIFEFFNKEYNYIKLYNTIPDYIESNDKYTIYYLNGFQYTVNYYKENILKFFN